MGKFNEGDIVKRINDYSNSIPVNTICKVSHSRDRHIRIEGHVTLFFSDNFELVFPKKWYIRGSQELAHWQKNDMEDECNCGLWSDYYFYYLIDDDLINGWNYYENRISPDDYIEITFEQFEEFVLKKNIRKPFKLTR